MKKGGALFEEMMQPILSLIDKTDDIRVLQEQMKSPAALKDLYQEMESAKLDDLIPSGDLSVGTCGEGCGRWMRYCTGKRRTVFFAEALEYLNQKKVLPKELYEELEDEAKAKAFTVSGYTALEILGSSCRSLKRQ